MKFTSCIVLSLLLSTAKAASFTPFRLSYDLLVNTPLTESDSLMRALTTNGILSVTGLPKSAKEAAVTMASSQHACLLETKNKEEQVFADGTLRRTVATHTVAGAGGMQPLAVDKTSACETFEAASVIVRKTTQVAVQAFAKHVTQGLPVQDGRPLLFAKDGIETGGEQSFSVFASFSDVVANGEHLEHFHSYQKFHSTTKVSSEEHATIDFHVDQGLFLAFIPGRLSNGDLTEGFYIQMKDGTTEEVEFNVQDDLVFLMGDGVNQFVNDKLLGETLRAVPHALKLQASSDPQQARVWYGLMVLPPSTAIHPMSPDGVTFGEIRQRLIAGGMTDDDKEDSTIYLACSSETHPVRVASFTTFTSTERFLSDAVSPDSCDNSTQLYCWHRCENLTADISSDQCATNTRKLACADASGKLWSGDTHGGYSAQCVELNAQMEVVAADEPAPAPVAKNPNSTSGDTAKPTSSSGAASMSVLAFFATSAVVATTAIFMVPDLLW